MGSKLENIEFKKQGYKPGPGTHNPEKRHDIPSMKFGSGQRSNLGGKTYSPGPGAYTGNNGTVQKATKSEKAAISAILRQLPGSVSAHLRAIPPHQS